MANAPKKRKRRPQAMIFGVALDSDGHKRLTTGSNFALVGGTEESHDLMTEKVIKINEQLKARGKRLAEVSYEEFDELVRTVNEEKS